MLKLALVLRLSGERERIVDQQFRYLEQAAMVVEGIVEWRGMAQVTQMPADFTLST
ncbi:hypothetical protein ACFSTC_53120 [Nonomuraea ferruginea]